MAEARKTRERNEDLKFIVFGVSVTSALAGLMLLFAWLMRMPG